jgi:hypothetical protein
VVTDDQLLVGTVRQRPGEGAEPGGVTLGQALPALVQVPGDLAGLPAVSGGRVDDHVDKEPVVGEPDQVALVQRAGAAERSLSLWRGPVIPGNLVPMTGRRILLLTGPR